MLTVIELNFVLIFSEALYHHSFCILQSTKFRTKWPEKESSKFWTEWPENRYELLTFKRKYAWKTYPLVPKRLATQFSLDRLYTSQSCRLIFSYSLKESQAKYRFNAMTFSQFLKICELSTDFGLIFSWIFLENV